MKYVVIQTELGGMKREFPIIFPDHLTHADVADGLMFLGCPELKNGKVVAAGFVSSMAFEGGCYGHSVTCQKDSREKVDDELIKMHDYMHGLVME